MNDFASFSEWTLALLPRLFLYPGGLWLLVLILGLRITSPSGITNWRWGGSLALNLPRDLLRTSLPSLAAAWAAVALLPLPGAPLLTFPTDKLALVGLVAISLAFDGYSARRWTGAKAELAMLTAVVAPLAGQTRLMDAGSGISAWLSLFAVFLGVAALSAGAATSLSLAARLVGWLGLASSPLWSLGRLEDPVRAVAVYTLLVLSAAVVGRGITNYGLLPLRELRITEPLRRQDFRDDKLRVTDWGLGAVCMLAALSLLAALLVP